MVSVQLFPCLLNSMDHFEDLFYFQEISCLCGDTVEELMWGLKVQMPYLLPDENLELNKEDRFPMSIGMKQLLHDYGFDCEPDLKVSQSSHVSVEMTSAILLPECFKPKFTP